jgi:hypothetical protein
VCFLLAGVPIPAFFPVLAVPDSDSLQLCAARLKLLSLKLEPPASVLGSGMTTGAFRLPTLVVLVGLSRLLVQHTSAFAPGLHLRVPCLPSACRGEHVKARGQGLRPQSRVAPFPLCSSPAIAEGGSSGDGKSQTEGVRGKRLFVGGVSPGVDETELKAALERFGAVENVELFSSRGFAFVDMASASCAAMAIASPAAGTAYKTVKPASPSPPKKLDFAAVPLQTENQAALALLYPRSHRARIAEYMRRHFGLAPLSFSGNSSHGAVNEYIRGYEIAQGRVPPPHGQTGEGVEVWGLGGWGMMLGFVQGV